MGTLRSAALLLAAVAALPAAHADGDAGRGAAVFATHCAECHSVREGKDKKGPSLYAVLGRPAAGKPGFAYSDAMKAAGITWTPEALDAYVKAPAQRVPGGKMKYDGLPSAAERADLIAYLQSLPAK